MSEDKQQEVYDEFYDLVNMQPAEIEDWLDTDESKAVGDTSGGGESKGRQSAKKIVEIKRTNKADLTDADYEHMQKVNGYIKRHRAQGPEEDVENSDWRYSLKNWGYDPCREGDC